MRDTKNGFSLVELLVVIAIIGVLISLLLPAVQAAREAARRMHCANNLTQLGVAMHNYHDRQNTFPFGWMVASDSNVQGWGVQVLPFLEQRTIHGQYDCRVPAFNEANLFTAPFTAFPVDIAKRNIDLIGTVLEVFLCPTAPGGSQRKYSAAIPVAYWGTDGAGNNIPPIQLTFTAAPSDYCPVTGVHVEYATIAFSGFVPTTHRYGAIQPAGIIENRSSRMSDITDGLSNTTLFGERVGGPEIYRLWAIAPHGPQNDVNGGGWGDFLNGEHWLTGSQYDGNGVGPCGINCTNKRSSGFFSLHPGGCNFALCDGSVRFIAETVSPHVLDSACTRAGGEEFSWEE